METLSLLALVFSLLLAMFIAWFLLQPFLILEKLSPDSTQDEEEQILRFEARERGYQALEDLEADFIGGKIDAETYQSLKAELAVEVSRTSYTVTKD